jgi:DNA primase
MLNQDLIEQAKIADLLQLASHYTRLKHVASSGGGEWAGPCPIPGCRCHNDGFRVQPQQKRWLCRNCTDGKWQDAIALVMRIEGLPFGEAVQRLAGHQTPTVPTQITLSDDAISTPPSSVWQRRARDVTLRAQELLWSPAGSQGIFWEMPEPQTGAIQAVQLSPLDWLRRRGLKDETIQKFQLGLIPRDARDDARNWGMPGKPLFLSQGITLPGMVGETCWYLKVRRARSKPKYLHMRGSKPAMFMANDLSAHSAILFCEGEFDAMLLVQEAGDLAGIATFGSASQHLDVAAWGWYLLHACRFLVAYDMDGKSENGAQGLLTLRHSVRANIPQLQPKDKDLTDFYKSGGDLRHWLTFWLSDQGGVA